MTALSLAYVCAALAASVVGAAHPYAYGRPYGPPKLPIWAARLIAYGALVRALYGLGGGGPVPVPDAPRTAGTGHLAHPGPSGVRAPGRAPGAYPACTRDGRDGTPWTTRARVVRGPGRRSKGGPAGAWVRVPGPHPGRTWPGHSALWWYMPGPARAGRTVDGVRAKYRRVRSRVRGRARRARKPGHMSGEYGRIFRAVLAFRDGPACFYCRHPFADPGAEATFDHYLPSALWLTGRRNAPWNLVLACQECNGAKGDTLPWPLVWLLLARLGGVERVELAAAA